MRKSVLPPHFVPIRFWPMVNQGCYARFRAWLREGGYSDHTITLYGVAVRLTFSLLDKPYWLIDLDEDLQQVRTQIRTLYPSAATQQTYFKGVAKLAAFLARDHRLTKPQSVNWKRYTAHLPEWLTAHLQSYLTHRGRSWRPEDRVAAANTCLSVLSRFLRFVLERVPEGQRLADLTDFTPTRWYAYVDQRLAAGISPQTINTTLSIMTSWLTFLADGGHPIDRRWLQIERLPEGPRLPKDVPPADLRRLYRAIVAETGRSRAHIRRMGVMDRAWFLLMLHSGLRAGEVRRLQLADVDLAGGRVRIEQSKGLKDRIVFLSKEAVEALEAWIALRSEGMDGHLFLYRHRPLTVTYCRQRLRTYGRRCGVDVTPHQLRHSCATLLLNAGASIVSVQALLGHKRIDTTVGYARLYDRTVAADYYRAMGEIVPRLHGPNRSEMGEFNRLFEELTAETLTEKQKSAVAQLKEHILALIP